MKRRAGQIENARILCTEHRDALRELTRIHLEIDAPNRRYGLNEPDWIFRLRKVCLHTVAITKLDISVDAVHVMATELRAAYVQMDEVWKRLPEEFRLDKVDGRWWANEARAGLLATYDHPTPLGLMFPLANGGLDEDEGPQGYIWVALWLWYLVLGYGSALAYLAQVLGSKEDMASRVAAVLNVGSGEPS